MSEYEIVPITFKVANQFVSMFHRHNKKVLSAKLYIGLMKGNELIGVAIGGRPVARGLDDGRTLEITRVCVKEGNPNANSMLYGRMAKVAQLMGYRRVITYTLKREAQSSLLAVGASPTEATKPHQWSTPSRQRHDSNIYAEPKVRWNFMI